jgi:hypothetical protein
MKLHFCSTTMLRAPTTSRTTSASRQSFRRLTVLLVLAVCLALPAAAMARVPQGFVGMTVDGPLWPATAAKINLAHQLDKMVASGVETVRVVFNWATTQPYRHWSDVPPGDASQYTDENGIPTNFNPIDQIVSLATERGLKVLPVVIYAPNWDASAHDVNNFAAPKKNRYYADFMTALIQRYGPHGTFWSGQPQRAPIRIWQVWNEPNIKHFWPLRPVAKTYVALLKAAHAAIKSADPGAKVVLAGIPNFAWVQLKSIYQIHGSRRLFDVVAVHPYTKKPKGVVTILHRVRSVMNKAGDSRKGIIADEVSWPSSSGHVPRGGLFNVGTTETGQAQRLSQLLPMLAKDRRSLNLLSFDWYTWAGVEPRHGATFDYSGLFRFQRGSFVIKPAFAAFRRAALTMEVCRQKGNVANVCLRTG